MLSFSEFHAALSSVSEDFEQLEIQGLIGFHHRLRTPAHEFYVFDFYVEELGFLHVLARDNFNSEILEWLIKSFLINRAKKYMNDTLHVYRAFDGLTFDMIGLCPPKIAQVYKEQSKVLSNYGYWLFPMYGIEFQHKFSQDQFWTQVRRRDKWKVEIVDWERKVNIIRGEKSEAPK